MDKLPKHAQKVFSGRIFDVYQWKQKMFDDSFETFEVISRQPSIQIIAVTTENKLVLLREEQPFKGSFLSLPGGVSEKNEKPSLTAKRELLEECGMRAKELALYHQVNFSSKIIWSSYYFIAKGCEITADQSLDAGEKISLELVDFDTFLEKIQLPEFRNRQFADMMFRCMHTKGELKKFKDLLFK
jgi:ADP-ribose pyrophosphatase YjhB (NUDIX family)